MKEVDKIDFFTLNDEEGNEHHFMYIDTIEVDGKNYWICDEAFPDENGEEIVIGDSVVFRIQSDGEDTVLESIEDEEEYEKVCNIWEKQIEEIDFEEGDFDLLEVEEKEEE
ncbi:DUF1292 domain-containing protein [Oceanotoga sp. DSM 15011]|jgi:uncharacterized protein YrzB (UPF0473 family)|uniref:Uncharacterized protein DUF1292 n=1 Tax=Oceanotoga teriensis TaxID=515440 RepID=A0AA45HHU6_9BACT|nr:MULTISPECIES: DUF1292 domain-containing protein [Oceanotoga]MDN5342974.1 hypothetical protein [Oceanotoga sp.]MDO7976162.1 DUF1292 domain-containing protein [Oceanotoga teriensis]PWJ88514.1 uncharacterized protein DUF1292 [Oceanotoga teriensis]UYP00998.1 DUF1292 domain-containing protein [Oceanotoga sp. DSM 15011]